MTDDERKMFKKLKKRVCKLEKIVKGLLNPVESGPLLRAIQFSTLTQVGFDPNNPSGQPALDRTVYHNGSSDDLFTSAALAAGQADATAIYADPEGTVLINFTAGLGEAYWDGSHYISFGDSDPDFVFVHTADGEIGG